MIFKINVILFVVSVRRMSPPSGCLGKAALLAHLSRRLKCELIVYQSSRRLSVCVCVCVCVSVCVSVNISATSGPIVNRFYLKHHWVGGKDALGFGPDRIGTLVSMAADSSHRNIMGEML